MAMKLSLNEYFQWYESQFSLLKEDRMADAKKSFPLVADKLAALSNVDPKYLMWAGKQLSVDSELDEKELETLLVNFSKAVNRGLLTTKDINSYSNVDKLTIALQGVSPKSNSQARKEAGADKIVFYKDKRFILLQPKTKDATCKYGKHTRWCISATEENKFDSLSIDNDFLILIDKEPSKAKFSKVAFQIDRTDKIIEVYDSEDKNIGMDELPPYPAELHAALENIFRQNFNVPTEEYLVDKFLEGLQGESSESKTILIKNYLTAHRRNRSQLQLTINKLSKDDFLNLMLTSYFSIVTIILPSQMLLQKGRELLPSVKETLEFIRSISGKQTKSYEFISSYLAVLEKTSEEEEEIRKLATEIPDFKKVFSGYANRQIRNKLSNNTLLLSLITDAQEKDMDTKKLLLSSAIADYYRNPAIRKLANELARLYNSGDSDAVEKVEQKARIDNFYYDGSMKFAVELFAKAIEKGLLLPKAF